MSRPGNPWDDALAESLFETLKRELVNGKGCKTREESKQDAFEYIEPCCNRQRMHSSIGYNAPCDLERDVARRSLFVRPRNLDQSNLTGPIRSNSLSASPYQAKADEFTPEGLANHSKINDAEGHTPKEAQARSAKGYNRQ